MRLCQTMALATGLPVALSQTIVVSRWFVTPMAAIWFGAMPALAIACRAVDSCDDQMASGSCSTCPGDGKICGNSCWADETRLAVLAEDDRAARRGALIERENERAHHAASTAGCSRSMAAV